MQFIEYMLWTHLDNKKINRLWSIIGFILIAVQPFASINILDPSKLKTILFGIYSISVVLTIFFFKHDFITTVGKNGHLRWNWIELNSNLLSILIWIVWFSALFIPLIIKTLQNKKYIIPFIITIAITILTAYNYYTDKEFGSMWCWLVNIIWIYVIYCGISKMVCN